MTTSHKESRISNPFSQLDGPARLRRFLGAAAFSDHGFAAFRLILPRVSFFSTIFSHPVNSPTTTNGTSPIVSRKPGNSRKRILFILVVLVALIRLVLFLLDGTNQRKIEAQGKVMSVPGADTTALPANPPTPDSKKHGIEGVLSHGGE